MSHGGSALANRLGVELYWQAGLGTTEFEFGDPRGSVEEQAASWWSRLELGTADQAAFDRWREADPRHAIAFARVQASWEALGDENRSIGEEPAAPIQMTRRRLLSAGGVGAACLLAGGTFYASQALAWDRATTGVGEFRRITLPDASMIELNTDTAVAWHFTRHARQIRLEKGEIAMALLSGAPATLLTKDADLALSPGRFNAHLMANRIGLTVLLGSARVQRRANSASPLAALKTGDAAELTPSGVAVQATTTESRALITAWQSGDIVFDDEPLQSAVDDYNRYLTTKIIVDPRLRHQRIGGRFTTTDPDTFLRAVALSLDADVQSSDSTIQITAKN